MNILKSFDGKVFGIKIFVFLIGVFIVQFGVALFIQSNAGVDSYTIIMEGIGNLLGITVGQANILMMVVIFIGMLLFAREYIRIGTFLATFMTGIFLDYVVLSLDGLGIGSLPYIARLGVLALGCVVIAIGFAILNAPELSVSPLDQLPLIIVDKTNFTYSQVRITQDIIFISVGYLLGGTLGLGTVIALFLVGPCIQFMLKHICEPLKRKINSL